MPVPLREHAGAHGRQTVAIDHEAAKKEVERVLYCDNITERLSNIACLSVAVEEVVAEVACDSVLRIVKRASESASTMTCVVGLKCASARILH